MRRFSRRVDSVSSTGIFARDAASGYRFLAYQMLYAATEALAMVLSRCQCPTGCRAGAT